MKEGQTESGCDGKGIIMRFRKLRVLFCLGIFLLGFFFGGEGRFCFVLFCFLVEMSNAHLDIDLELR